VGAHLRRLRRDRLVELLLEHAGEDERLAMRLRLLALRANTGPAKVGAYRSLIDRAIAVEGFVRPDDAPGYLTGVRDAVEALEQLVADGHAVAAVELSEHALGAIETAMGRVDDAGGRLAELAERLVALHRAACGQGRPEPVGLAERLFAWEMQGKHDLFQGAVASYADVLGRKGLKRYRDLADERWESVPALAPGDPEPEPDAERPRITGIMEALAEMSGNVEHVVAVRSRDLSRPDGFLAIAELYRERDDTDAALAWIERGLRAFEPPDPRLRALAAEEYRRGGRGREALEQAWLAFRDRPALDTYHRLKADAEAAEEWPQLKDSALAFLANGGGARGPSLLSGRDGSEIVQIFLAEDDEDAAWKHAVKHGCSDELWRELASRRRAEHPRDALVAYERLLGTEKSYKEVTALMDEIRDVLYEIGEPDEISRYVDLVRDPSRGRRTLVKLFGS
jgi:tetratricopeptide (TPR) repeat protein